MDSTIRTLRVLTLLISIPALAFILGSALKDLPLIGITIIPLGLGFLYNVALLTQSRWTCDCNNGYKVSRGCTLVGDLLVVGIYIAVGVPGCVLGFRSYMRRWESREASVLGGMGAGILWMCCALHIFFMLHTAFSNRRVKLTDMSRVFGPSQSISAGPLTPATTKQGHGDAQENEGAPLLGSESEGKGCGHGHGTKVMMV